MHLFASFYFVVVLALEADWGRPYHELVELWTLGAVLVGLGALPAGWLADRVGAPPMMTLMFFGMGGAALACSRAAGTEEMRVGLAALGLCASIYHPVGIPWVVRCAVSRGRALGINGVFGNLGVAAAALVAGWLIEISGWRAAFAVPGVVSLGAGIVLCVAIALGRVGDGRRAAAPAADDPGAHRWLGFGLLLFTMASVGIVGLATQAALPKHFARRVVELGAGGALGIGAAVAVVYTVAGLMQIAGGQLADRLPPRRIYMAGLALQVPVLMLVAGLGGWFLVAAAAAAALLNTTVLPAENLLLSRLTPSRHHGLAFGTKFVVAFGTAPLAVQLVSWIDARTGGLSGLFVVLAIATAAAVLAARRLPEPSVA